MASRGSTTDQIINDSLWWHGPNFLRQGAGYWPSDPNIEPNHEQRKVKKSVHMVSNTVFNSNHQRFSDYKRLRNVHAYILRFIKQMKSKTSMYLQCKNLKMPKYKSYAHTRTKISQTKYKYYSSRKIFEKSKI